MRSTPLLPQGSNQRGNHAVNAFKCVAVEPPRLLLRVRGSALSLVTNRYSGMYLMPKSPQCNLLDVTVRRGLNEPTLALRAAQSVVNAATNTAPAAHESPYLRQRSKEEANRRPHCRRDDVSPEEDKDVRPASNRTNKLSASPTLYA